MLSKHEIDTKLNLVANRMMTLKNNGIEEKFPVSLIDINCWEWPQGVGLFGLYRYYETSKREDVLEFLTHWYDERLAEGIREKNVNTTSPMLTLTYIYEITKKPAYLDQIKEWCDWIMADNGLIRTGDGCFQHMITGDANADEILIDTLFMAVFFLYRAGKLLNKPEYIHEGSYQMLSHVKYLLDKNTGLFFHGFNFKRNDNYGEVHWGRGNCWYTVVALELMKEVDLEAGLKRFLLKVYENQVMALKQYADPETGLWHTVIDDADSYLELSGSAAFLFGIMQGVRLGFLPKTEYQDLIEKAMAGVISYIEADGTVGNVSYGTPIGMDKEFYKNIVCCPMTYGQALVILLLQEALADYWH